ncbi:TVP38/TMEM64 family protein [Pseudalkalibacillus berkeleyi]|uniref:TVP38/TMEM64 family membrane protein n=1 Tax=Pseudalkalibacillus berkeleyi TaxID=1069813 RepID=A0ABS9H0H4_9BACL|nr:TVP38/TMEM64 family protein [Pseudalkalibacillus berkeleyi]MCF6137343.1 TVP38/TMEM64 family protein [Pseudalkalibacillus berkeleyi]
MAAMILFLILIGNKVNHDPEQLRNWFISFGIFSPLMYVVFCSLRPVILFPFLILTVAGGLAFGPIFGTLLTIIGGLIGASISFYISRKYGDLLKIESRERFQALTQKIDQKGFQYVLILRLVPLLNFDIVSYSSGLTSIRYKPYILATSVGMIPGTVGLNYIGSSLVSVNMKEMIIVLALLFIVFILSIGLKRYMSNRLD